MPKLGAQNCVLHRLSIRHLHSIPTSEIDTHHNVAREHTQENHSMERKTANDYPQELLNLFDTYVHGGIDRRTFLEGAQKFAVGGITAAAIWESLRPDYALANQVPADDARIKTEDVVIKSPKGNKEIKCYFVTPHADPDKKKPGVIVIHENRGLNPYVKDVARRLAAEGYLALAPDGLSSVGGYPGDDEKGGALFQTVDKAKMLEDFIAAAHWLKSNEKSTGKLGAVGFCFGGGIVNKLAVNLGSDLNAGVPFYGGQPTAEETAKIKAPLMIQYAGLDTRVNAGWPAWETALKADHVKYEAFIYEGANHGFHNDTTPRYDEKSAKLAWKRTLEFFAKNLK